MDEDIDWEKWADTPASIERARVEGGDPWFTAAIAGLQYHDYDEPDGLGGTVIPETGDRLQLVREPGNRADKNAIQVHWRNRYLLGHLPREVARVLAPSLDAGESCRAYVWCPGDGTSWSAIAWLVGPACAGLVSWRLKKIEEAQERNREVERNRLEREIRMASEAVWGGSRLTFDGFDVIEREDSNGHEPTAVQCAAFHAFEDSRRARRLQREADLTYALNLVDAPDDPMFGMPDETMRGHTYTWWDQVPTWLATKTTMRTNGYRIPKGVRPFALIAYGGWRDRKCYELFAYIDAVPIRRTRPEVGAYTAEDAFKKKNGIKEMYEEIPF